MMVRGAILFRRFEQRRTRRDLAGAGKWVTMETRKQRNQRLEIMGKENQNMSTGKTDLSGMQPSGTNTQPERESGFNEMVHAYIAAKFYHYLTERFGERGKQAFIHGTQLHAGQRGRRMAQRAIRNGEELNFETYSRYGEWVNTETAERLGLSNQSEVVSWGPDFENRVYACPWQKQFEAMGMTEAGEVYCQHLDNSICRGFNPYLSYEVTQTLHRSDCCIHIVRNAGMKEGTDCSKRPEGLKSFEYHCANSFWAYSEVSAAIFQAQGEAVSAAVLADFERDYGKEMADRIMRYRDVNFNVVDG